MEKKNLKSLPVEDIDSPEIQSFVKTWRESLS
jgi:hypothetical protein